MQSDRIHGTSSTTNITTTALSGSHGQSVSSVAAAHQKMKEMKEMKENVMTMAPLPPALQQYCQVGISNEYVSYFFLLLFSFLSLHVMILFNFNLQSPTCNLSSPSSL